MSHQRPDPEIPQRRAADPRASAWVAASAGTGKTKVLIDRTLRLLLAGTPPHKLLCLTFTKAAAAEMANRVAMRLADWATADDRALAAEVSRLLGARADDDCLARARRLFAQVLDTPGGMKVQTIHAFCQSLLRRFPSRPGWRRISRSWTSATPPRCWRRPRRRCWCAPVTARTSPLPPRSPR